MIKNFLLFESSNQSLICRCEFYSQDGIIKYRTSLEDDFLNTEKMEIKKSDITIIENFIFQYHGVKMSLYKFSIVVETGSDRFIFLKVDDDYFLSVDDDYFLSKKSSEIYSDRNRFNSYRLDSVEGVIEFLKPILEKNSFIIKNKEQIDHNIYKSKIMRFLDHSTVSNTGKLKSICDIIENR